MAANAKYHLLKKPAVGGIPIIDIAAIVKATILSFITLPMPNNDLSSSDLNLKLISETTRKSIAFIIA